MAQISFNQISADYTWSSEISALNIIVRWELVHSIPILTFNRQECSWDGQKVSNVCFAMSYTAVSCVFISTGLPKAAVITHLQSLKAAGGFYAFGVTEDDVMYIPLPLYHSAASLIGIGGTIELGRPQNISTWLILLYSLYVVSI